MLKVVLDTNIYISAILFDGKSEDIIKLVREGIVEVLISEAVILEIAEVLRRKFGWESWQISQVIDGIRETATLTIPHQSISLLEDDADNRVLECAIEGDAGYIITGDKRHLLPLKEREGIRIVSPDEFLRPNGPIDK
jgi:putative PIN family toxin of toxin-antitoxin system